MVTNRCNLACLYCYAAAHGRGVHMTEEVASEALELLDRAPGRTLVELAGGEPLLNFDLIRFLLKKYGGRYRFALQTNGLLLDAPKLNFLAEHGVGLGLSLDGPPRVNDLSRGRGPTATHRRANCGHAPRHAYRLGLCQPASLPSA